MATVVRWSPKTGYGKDDGEKVDYKDSAIAKNISNYLRSSSSKKKSSSSSSSSSKSVVDKAIQDYINKTGGEVAEYHTPRLSGEQILWNGYQYDPNYYQISGNTVVPKSTIQNGIVGLAGNQNDIQAEIQRLAELKKKQAIAQLEKSRNAALSNLASEKSQIQPRYYQARNDASVQNKLAAKSFQEYIANRGLRNSGENDQARLMQNMALQNQIGALKQQEAQAYGDISRRETDINNAYQSDLASIQAGLDAQSLQNAIDEMRRQEELGLKRDQIAYDRYRDTIADERYNKEFALKQEAAELDNQLTRLQLSNYPLEQQLRIEQLRKQIQQIGKTPYRSPEDIEADRLKVELLKQELAQAQNQSLDRTTIQKNYADAFRELEQNVGRYSKEEALQYLQNIAPSLDGYYYQQLRDMIEEYYA